jgi:hypothetical protein
VTLFIRDGPPFFSRAGFEYRDVSKINAWDLNKSSSASLFYFFLPSYIMPNDKKPGGIFSSVINDLVRSAIGANARQVSDQDLDSYVTDLITNEAKAKQAKYKTQGVRAYQPNPQPT